jgi:acetyltransferase-like isoleucine patch superfamily enzyme
MKIINKIINWNRKFWFKKLCKFDRTTKFYDTSCIINNLNTPSTITIGANSHVKGELLVFGHGGNISVGSYCYIGENARIWSGKKIEIGNRVLISHDVNIFDNLIHPINPELRHKQFVNIITIGQPKQIGTLDEREVKICDDVLIGAAAIILRGVTIGKCSIIGAGSVVTKSIPPYSIVAGNPARIIRELSGDER